MAKAYSADALKRSRGYARTNPGEEWVDGPLGMSTGMAEDIRESTRLSSMAQMWIQMKRRTRDIDIEREVQNENTVDMYLRMAQENADRNYISTRDSILIKREWNERHNGMAEPPAACAATDYDGTTRPRHTRLMSASRRQTYGEVGYGMPSQEAELSPHRAALAAHAIYERSARTFHGDYGRRLRYDD